MAISSCAAVPTAFGRFLKFALLVQAARDADVCNYWKSLLVFPQEISEGESQCTYKHIERLRYNCTQPISQVGRAIHNLAQTST